MLTDFIDKKTANVYGIYGHLGGGKSLTAVELSLWALRLGWTVTSNIELRNIPKDCVGKFNLIEDFESVATYVDPTNSDNCGFWSLPCGAPRASASSFRSVIVIDECAEFFDQYSSSSPVLKSFLSWLRHSSKRGQFVFLIVQKPEFIAKALRLLINKWIICDDMYQFRLPVLKVKIPFTSNFVARRVFDRMGNLLSRGFNFADKRDIGRFYNTAQSIALLGKNNDFNGSFDEEYDPNALIYNIFCVLYIIFLIYYV